MQLGQPERKRADGLDRPHDGQRHDRLPGPAGPVGDVQREPAGQVDQLGRHDRQVVPGPLAEQGQPDPGEHPGGGDAAAVADPARGLGHVVGVGRVAGQPQGHVGLDRGGQLGLAVVGVGPGAVGALLRPDPAGGGVGQLGGADAQELAQQQVLGLDRDVGLQLALPPALLVLQVEQVTCGPAQGRSRGGPGLVLGCLATDSAGRGHRHRVISIWLPAGWSASALVSTALVSSAAP